MSAHIYPFNEKKGVFFVNTKKISLNEYRKGCKKDLTDYEIKEFKKYLTDYKLI